MTYDRFYARKQPKKFLGTKPSLVLRQIIVVNENPMFVCKQPVKSAAVFNTERFTVLHVVMMMIIALF